MSMQNHTHRCPNGFCMLSLRILDAFLKPDKTQGQSPTRHNGVQHNCKRVGRMQYENANCNSYSDIAREEKLLNNLVSICVTTDGIKTIQQQWQSLGTVGHFYKIYWL